MSAAAVADQPVVREAPFGEWESPITAESITASAVGIRTLASAAGRLFWLESRPEEGGRYVVVSYDPSSPNASERGGVDAIPADHNARTRVHEYGGGEFLVAPDGSVIYSNFKDQRLYRARSATDVQELTPKASFEQDGLFRYADGVLDVPRNRLICVREDHTKPSPAEVQNTIVAVALDGTGTTTVIAEGSDFYSAPRLSPDGSTLAFLSWNHPHMPWDATALNVVRLDENGIPTGEPVTVAGGCEAEMEEVSVLQPAWSPAGELFFVSDESGWWNIFKVPKTLSAQPDSNLQEWRAAAVNILRRDADFCGWSAGWVLGQQGYAFTNKGNVVTAEGGHTLMILAPDGKILSEATHSEGLPPAFGVLTAGGGDEEVFLIGTSPTAPTAIFSWSPAGDAPAKKLVSCMKASSFIPRRYVSYPKAITFPTKALPGSDIDFAYGNLYEPCNGDFTAPTGTLPPLLVKAHGGPTSRARTSFNPGIQFWTSRGFAVLDVDYRGSSGYGTAYRRELRGHWGICDIDDVCFGAKYLVDQGLVDGARLAIDGGSAGGYTTLGALAFRNVFSAGCSLYGVADLGALAADTHKFESRYLDKLVGRWPQDKGIYDERAPINSCDTLSCPVLLLQGDEDKIVPPNQAERMYAALKAKHIPCALKIYAGEQHGFRKAENIQDALNAELYFYGRVFGFSPSGGYEGFPIDNLD